MTEATRPSTRTAPALERHGIDTVGWFERQLALCCVGVMLQLGWEKAFDETGADLAWWRDRTVDTAHELAQRA